MILSQYELISRKIVHPLQHTRLTFDESGEGLLWKPACPDRLDRIRGEAVTNARRNSYEITGQRKSDNLPPAIWQQLVEPNGPFRDIETRVGLISLREQRLL